MLPFRTTFRIPRLFCYTRFLSRIPSVPLSTRPYSNQSRDSVDTRDLPTTSVNQHEVFIQWDGATRSKFHHIWLRDHCRCPECFHPVTKQRLINTFEIPPDLEPIFTRPTPDGLQVVYCIPTPGPASTGPHVSIYPWSWLRQNSYCPPTRQEPTEKILWGSKIAKDPPSVAYDEVMSNERGVYKWLSRIDKFGFCFVQGIPPTPEATEDLSVRIGFIRETHYGKFWDFTADLSRGDTSYSNVALPAHTDNTYFTDPSGIQLFHLLEHTEGSGGATLLVDGFYVASILRDLYPEAHRLLSTVPIPAHAAGESAILYRAARARLEHDAVGNLRAVRWNNADRSVLRGVPYADVPRLYEAMRTWDKLITSQDSEYWVKLSPGTAITIDNHRVLHGRSAFTGKRRMCGAYVGADEFRSRLAALSEQFTSSADETTSGARERGVWSHDF
ncbi:hypothetical protein BJV78DRAFT_1328612 [Lactifluus subvellereus]|nr:hypothetical protein BJV78DRAFT_1328612 [Lactifluus subvellereus]